MKQTLSISALVLLVTTLISSSTPPETAQVYRKKKKVVTYEVGDTAHGGIVFFVNKDGSHGLVAALTDQMDNSNYQDCYDGINDPLHHDKLGAQYTDWRLPKLWEAYKMYMNLHMVNLGGFSASGYWTTKETVGFEKIHVLNFSKGVDFTSMKSDTYRARGVRSF
ncbi:MAG: hypothetical protein HUJ25_04345 [Crocinitomicaceae bacterium]|nr:hypothetical protein [Crocinitomicaceae bacterium]